MDILLLSFPLSARGRSSVGVNVVISEESPHILTCDAYFIRSKIKSLPPVKASHRRIDACCLSIRQDPHAGATAYFSPSSLCSPMDNGGRNLPLPLSFHGSVF